MEIIREGPSASRSPILDDAEEQASVGNARAINAIFNGVDLNVFKLINFCITAKEAWKIQEVAYEGTSKVKIFRLQFITLKFKALKMTEDKTVSKYNERVLNTTGKTEKTDRHDGENSIRKVNDFSYRRNNDHEADSECSDIDEDEELTLEELKMLRKEDSEARAIQKERIQDLMDENERLMRVISSPKDRMVQVNMASDLILQLGCQDYSRIQTHVNAWYFDSGCSRHMTDNQSFSTELEECASGHVTFGDGAKGKIIAKGNIDKSNLPYLNEVRYVDGLKANLISIHLVRFLKGKSDTVKLCISLCLNLQHEKGQKIIRIRSDHGKEFDNEDLNNFCQTKGIHHEFAAPITPKQNGVVERKNRTLQEMARVMIHAKNFPLNFWAEAVNTTCHIHNRVTTRFADREYHRKWDVKSDQGIFLGYSHNSRAYRVFNIKSETVMETINVVVNDFESNVNRFNIEDDETHVIPEVTSSPLDEMPKGDSQPDNAKTNSNITDEVINNDTVLVSSAHVKKNDPSSSIIGDPSAGITTRRK
ncbi:gag-pol polyprotein [Cucumis melo var. makuwa]|uniref:Gag-pol polyprotein n=1 Tax=Cucumis melo var. makuwa TaxID=1194695 RepID=A0A5A7V3T4_CUCMM|nr:gag-pol polyprotein [Cucumis melo var. makuwa]TYK22131.1 gag-pol polyprotein [Cucumis melo var. makuwa]